MSYKCGRCLTPFVDGQPVYAWLEDYICKSCASKTIKEQASRLIWHPPETP